MTPIIKAGVEAIFINMNDKSMNPSITNTIKAINAILSVFDCLMLLKFNILMFYVVTTKFISVNIFQMFFCR